MKINEIRLLNGNCLIEVVGKFDKETSSGLMIGDVNYNKGDHATRYGILTRMPSAFNWSNEVWKTDYFPDEGDEVWFEYLEAKDAEIVKEGGKTYVILPYKSLIVARSIRNGIKVLNGYLLAKKQPLLEKNVLDFKERFYDDVYQIIHAGKPNISYKPDKDAYGNITREFMDDTSITEGMIIMTRSSFYPTLEDSLHRKFCKEDFWYFQRRDVVAKVVEL